MTDYATNAQITFTVKTRKPRASSTPFAFRGRKILLTHPALRIIAVLTFISTASAQVQHGSLSVIENDSGNSPSSVTVQRSGGYGPWITIQSNGSDTSNRGDYMLDFLTGSDQSNGVLVVTPYEAGRSEPSVEQSPYYGTLSASTSTSGSGRYFVSVHQSPNGAEVNYNPAFAYFPIEDGWITGAAYNTSNNGPLTQLVGHPDLILRTDATFTGEGYELLDSTGSNGYYLISLEGIDLRRDGVVLATASKNEDNRTAINVGMDGRATIHCADNGSETGGENDPAGFVLIPEGTEGIVMGRVTASGHKLFAQGAFDVELINQPPTNGTYRLTISGETPTTGTLLVVPHSELSGITNDNFVGVVPDGDGWIIQTYDIEPLPEGPTVQDLGAGDVVFHFVFLKYAMGITPATPPRIYRKRFNDLVSARFHVTELSPGNALGEMHTSKAIGSTALNVFADNRGDVGISYLSVRLAAHFNSGLDAFEGVILGVPTEFYRDNSDTGGTSGWSTFSFDDAHVRSHRAVSGGEINSDFAIALFPNALGLLQSADVGASDGQGLVPVGMNAVDEGVLMAINWDNNNRVVSATPQGDAYAIRFYDGESGEPASDSTEYGYVHIPYHLQELVAGHVDANGNVISGVGNFEVTIGTSDHGFGVTKVEVAGVDAGLSGVLLVTPTAGPYAMAWEPQNDGTFAVAGLHLPTNTPGRAAFMFAYIPFDSPCIQCTGDYNADCLVNMNDAAALIADMNIPDGTDLADFAELQRHFLDDCDEIGAGPNEPQLVAPIHDATVPGPSVPLSVNVSTDDEDPINVTFYGRRLNNAEPFTLVTLPDTQHYSESYPDVFMSQTQWIIANIQELNIAYVAHLGDIVQYADVIDQWENANDAISVLDTLPTLPYGLAVGNHDQDPCCSGAPDGTDNFNMYFPYARYAGVVDWYGGHYGNDNDNHYCFFSAGGMEFIVLHFEFDTSANPDVLAWADQLLTQHSDKRAIIAMHYLCRTGNPAPFSSQGAATYQALKHHSNLFMMHGGHISGEGIRTDTYDGSTIYSILSDYQNRPSGGDGWLRYYEFQPANNQIVARTYSTTLNIHELDANSQFVLPYDMTDEGFVNLGTVSEVESGTTATFEWSSLEPGGRYEWYVRAQDNDGRTFSATWRFTVE